MGLPLFAFPLQPAGGRCALALAASLRGNGGALAQAPLVALTVGERKLDPVLSQRLREWGVELVAYEPDPRLAWVRFGGKADAARAAEGLARARGLEGLVWLDLDSYVVAEPTEFRLPAGTTLAYRPVHHRLIGQGAGEPLDAFWTGVYTCCGVEPEMSFPVLSTLDRQEIHFYPNAGCLALQPGAGLLAAWAGALACAAEDPRLRELTGADPLRALFLHQVVLAGTLLRLVPRSALRELPFAYNYPLHLHRQAPEALKPRRLEELVTVRYEDFPILEGDSGLAMSEASRRAIAATRT